MGRLKTYLAALTTATTWEPSSTTWGGLSATGAPTRGAATLCATDATCAAQSAEQSRVPRVFDRAGEAAGCGVIDGVSSAKNSIRSISEMRLPEQMTAAVPTVRVSYSLQALQIQFGPGLQSFHLQAEEKK